MPVKGLAVLNEFNNINYVVLLIEPFFFGKLQYAAVKFSALKNDISIFFARSWSVGTALILDTQNPEISGLSTAHAYNTKPNGKQK